MDWSALLQIGAAVAGPGLVIFLQQRFFTSQSAELAKLVKRMDAYEAAAHACKLDVVQTYVRSGDCKAAKETMWRRIDDLRDRFNDHDGRLKVLEKK